RSAPVVSTPEEAVTFVNSEEKDGKRKYKIAIFAPYMANSQLLWNKRVGEELAKAGHAVTIYLMSMYEMNSPKVGIDPKIRVVHVNGSFGLSGEEMMKDQAFLSFNDVPVWDPRFRKSAQIFAEMYKSCELFVKDKKFLADVETSKFDIAFTHMYNNCPIGIIHHARIPTWIWLNSGALMENVAELMGVPVPPSYCPPIMMDAGEELGFVGRVKSFIGHATFKVLWRTVVANKETEIFRKEFGQDFPDIIDLMAKAPLVMVNSNELYDFPRPTISKIVNIGGVGIKTKHAKPLTQEFSSRIEKAKGIIVMSFGSIAPMYLMPDHWKEAYFHAFAQFPDVQFFLRYEKVEEIASKLPPNALAVKWLPQSDLLQHPKCLGLISHGGYNSVQDVMHAGVPIVTTALFADQPRNAHLVERLGMGVNLHKSSISKETVVAAIRRLVEDQSLKQNAQKMKSMIATKPVSSENLLVKWTEFLVQHKKLDNLVPYGVHLNFFVYHSLDVIVFLTATVLSVLSVLFLILRRLFKFCYFFGIKRLEDIQKKKN
ncbi:hypothetical protein PFISCL1PPCAC_7140, partial [Pristionchus fissidentatus]